MYAGATIIDAMSTMVSPLPPSVLAPSNDLVQKIMDLDVCVHCQDTISFYTHLRNRTSSPMLSNLHPTLISANQRRRTPSGICSILCISARFELTMATSVFETTIRYLGGLLSAYELSGKQYQPLLDKAKEVADKMAYAWVGVSCLCFVTNIIHLK